VWECDGIGDCSSGEDENVQRCQAIDDAYQCELSNLPTIIHTLAATCVGANGEAVAMNGALVASGSVCNFLCESGYSGSFRYICQRSGEIMAWRNQAGGGTGGVLSGLAGDSLVCAPNERATAAGPGGGNVVINVDNLGGASNVAPSIFALLLSVIALFAMVM
jgi:hypothetical protein